MGARIRKSPFFEATNTAGVKSFSVYNHMLMPVSYGNPEAEYWRIINQVSIWDVAVERQVELRGPDAEILARLLTPRKMNNCPVGIGKYVPMCDHQGRLLNDPILLRIDDDRYWLSIASSDMIYWTRAIAAERGLDVEVTEPNVSPLAIQGPLADRVISDLFGNWPTELKYFGFKQTKLNNIPLVLAKSGWSKQGGYELYLMDSRFGTELWNLVMEAGKPYGIGPGAPNSTERVESALLSYGADTDDDTNPFEVRLEKYVNLDQGFDFIGKSALIAIVANGVKRRQAGFLIDGSPLPPLEHKVPVLHKGVEVGFCGVALVSRRLDRNIGIGLLSNKVGDDQTVVIRLPEGDREAIITALPFC